MSKLDVAVKNDGAKNRVELLPPLALEKIAEVLTFGAKKYADHNWRKGFKWSRLIGAVLRHVFAFMRGEDMDYDPKCQGCIDKKCTAHTGLSHLACAGCEILFLIEHFELKMGEDDRYGIARVSLDVPGLASKPPGVAFKPMFAGQEYLNECGCYACHTYRTANNL